MVIAVRFLRCATRVDHIDLGRDLVGGPQPGGADEVDEIVAVVVDEHLRIVQRQLFKRIPDSVVRAGLGEVVAATNSVDLLLLDQFEERHRRSLDDGLFERSPQHHDSGPVQEGVGQLAHYGPSAARRHCCRAQ